MRLVLSVSMCVLLAAGCSSPNSKSGPASSMQQAEAAAISAALGQPPFSVSFMGVASTPSIPHDVRVIFFANVNLELPPIRLDLVRSRYGGHLPRLDTDLTHLDALRLVDKTTGKPALIVNVLLDSSDASSVIFRIAKQSGGVGGEMYAVGLNLVDGNWRVVMVRLVGVS